jgi:hypothetical protein
MSYTVLYISGGDFGDFDEMLVRCKLYNPASEIEVDHRDGSGWQQSGMQSAQARGTREGLGQLVRVLVAQSLQADPDTVEFETVDAESLPVGKRGKLGLLPAPDAKTTDYTTTDGLRVYDLDPQAGDLWAVAGPDGHDPREIDVDDLPQGWRWVDEDEWSSLVCTEGQRNEYEIHGYSVRMTTRQAAAWNAGDLSGETLAGATISPDGERWVDLWPAIDHNGNDTSLYDELGGYPANLISTEGN